MVLAFHTPLHCSHQCSSFLMPPVTSLSSTHASEHGSHAPDRGSLVSVCGCHAPVLFSTLPIPVVVVFWIFLLLICLCFFFFLCYLGYFLILRETFVFEFVLVPFFFVIPNSDFNSAFIALAFFWWLLLFSSVGTNRFVLICTSQCDAPFIFIQNGITIVV